MTIHVTEPGAYWVLASRTNPTVGEPGFNIRVSCREYWKSSCMGDLNADGKVDMKDIAIVAKAYGSLPGDSNWNSNADINGDNKVDIKDIAMIAKKFGESCPGFITTTTITLPSTISQEPLSPPVNFDFAMRLIRGILGI